MKISWKSPDKSILFCVIFATLLGGMVRFYPVFQNQFPLNDGGLFYSMAQDIVDNHFALPFYTSYNENTIPFGYPPLSFYLLAILQKFLHIGFIDQLRFLPAVFSTLSIPLIYFLGKNITSSKVIAAFAVFAYALTPESYQWQIMGGGISRSLGLALAMLSILSIWKMFTRNSRTYLLLSILFSALLILCHPAIAWFVFITSFLMGLFYGRNKWGVINSVLTIAGILVLTSPWWITMILRYGMRIFLSAGQSSGFVNFSVISLFLMNRPFVNIFIVVAIFGIFAELTRRKFFLFAWLIVITIIPMWLGQVLATIPASILFGSGVVWVIYPGLLSFKKVLADDYLTLEKILQEKIVKIAFAFILCIALTTAIAAPILNLTGIQSVSTYDREAMAWVSQNTPATSQFALLTGDDNWGIDPQSEWFPALAERTSITTVQGSEWEPNREFERRVESYNQLQKCAEQDYSCTLAWASGTTTSFTHIYISKKDATSSGVSLPIIDQYKSDAHFIEVFDNPGVTIFEVVGVTR